MNKIKTNKKVNNINMKLVIAFCIIFLILVIPVTVLAEDAADTAASTAESTQTNDSSGVESSSSQTGSTNSTESSGTNDSTASNNSEPTPVNDTEISNDNPESQPSDDNPAESQTTAEPEITPQSDNLNDSEQAEPTDSNDANSGPDGDEGETGDSGNSNNVDDTPVSEDPTTPQSTPDEESAPAENTTVGNSYTAEVTSERVVGTGKEDTSFTVSFMEVGEHTPLGSVQLTLPDGFSDLSLVEGSIQASDGKSWTGGVVDLVLSLWAQNADSYLGQGESVDATFTATTPTEAGIYTFGTEAWTDASTDFDDIGTTTNNMAAGYSDPTVGVFEINSPVQISTVEQLEHLSGLTNADDLAKDYEQTANIDFSTKYNKDGSGQWPEWNDGKGWDPIGTNSNPFTGTYDGQEYTISNLFINRPDENNQGLFGVIGSVPVQAVLKNIGLEKVNITGKGSVGGLVGRNNDGTIDSSYATGVIDGKDINVGGLVGYNNAGTVTSSYATSNVTGNGGADSSKDGDRIGGLVGWNDDGTIQNSYATGYVIGISQVGGLAGVNSGSIESSSAYGTVEGDANVGGLVGTNNKIISNSFASGDVTGTGVNTGGLVGYNNAGTINNSYAIGDVEGITKVGGLVGLNDNNGTINNSFWDTQTSGQTTSAGGTGLPTAEMKKLSTFTGAGWDITGQDGSYPKLSWEVNWSANTWYMVTPSTPDNTNGTPPAPDNTNGGSFGGGFGFFDFEFAPGLALLAQNGTGLTTLTGQGNAPITPGIIASGNWNDLNQAVAAYQAALVALENNITTLSPAELALLEVELVIARAAILALEAKLLAADGKPFNLFNLQAAYAAAVAAFNPNQSFLGTDQQAVANQLLTAIAGVIAALE